MSNHADGRVLAAIAKLSPLFLLTVFCLCVLITEYSISYGWILTEKSGIDT